MQVIPATAQYRQAVEKTYAHRLDVCSKHTEVEEIESVIGQGQIEELLRMARDEERLIPKMAGARAPIHVGHSNVINNVVRRRSRAILRPAEVTWGEGTLCAARSGSTRPAEWKPWDVPDDYKVTMTEYKDNLPKPKA